MCLIFLFPGIYADEYAPQLMRNTASSNMSTLITEQRETLQCALQYDQAEHVVYFVRSTMEPETEAVVERVLMSNSTETDGEGQPPFFEVSSHHPQPPGMIRFMTW